MGAYTSIKKAPLGRVALTKILKTIIQEKGAK